MLNGKQVQNTLFTWCMQSQASFLSAHVAFLICLSGPGPILFNLLSDLGFNSKKLSGIM